MLCTLEILCYFPHSAAKDFPSRTMLLFVVTKVKLQREVSSSGTGAISIMALIKLCPSGTADFGVPQSPATFGGLCVFKNNIDHCRWDFNTDKQTE